MSLSPIVQDSLIERLKSEITDGTLPPGSRLPSRLELCRRFAVSSVTLQKAVDRLVADGFLSTRARRGTFVAARLPHQHVVGVVFPRSRSECQHVPFWHLLVKAFDALALRENAALRFYWSVDWQQPADEMARLRADVDARRLGGLVHVNPPGILAAQPWWRTLTLPQIALVGVPRAENCPGLVLDYPSFYEQAGRLLKDLGRRRVAVLDHSPGLAHWPEIDTRLRELDLQVDPAWQLMATPPSVFPCLRLLFSQHMREKPDGLIVSDDTLLPAVMASISSLPLRLPDDLQIVSLANFPAATAAPASVHRIGFDLHAYAARALRLVHAAMAGSPLPELTPYAAVAESRTEAVKVPGSSP